MREDPNPSVDSFPEDSVSGFDLDEANQFGSNQSKNFSRGLLKVSDTAITEIKLIEYN